MSINELLEKYLADKNLSWAPTTLKSERYRLQAVSEHLNGNAESLWMALKDNGPYSRLTTWVRVTDFYQWCLDERYKTGGNPYRAFKKKNQRLFKYAYERKVPQISYEEAQQRIEQIPDPAIRRRATEILSSGMRWCESGRHEDGSVVGKGSKRRDVFVPKVDGPDFTGSYETIRQALKKIGLSCHGLRKIFANRLVECGANQFELMEIAGWASINTASSYIKANSDRTRRLVQMVQGVSTDASEVKVPPLLPTESGAA